MTMHTDELDVETPFENLTSKADALMEMSRTITRIDALVEQLERDRAYYKALNQWTDRRFGPITQSGSGPALPRQDGRKTFNLEKNLKISAIRCYSWAKTQGKTAEAARERAIKKTDEKARTNYSMAGIPASVSEYIELLYQNFAQIGKKEISVDGM